MTAGASTVRVKDGEIQLRVVMNIGPKWKNVDLLRTAILNCVAVIVGEGDASNTVGIIVSELLENAIKYGEWSDATLSTLTLDITGNHDCIRIDVASPVRPGSSHYEELKKTVEWIRSFSAPREAYLERIRQVADEDGLRSRLGLVRIAHEGPCALDVRLLPETSMVVTTAVTEIAPRSRA